MKFLQVPPLVLLTGLVFTAPALAVGVTQAPMAMDGTTILPDPSLAHTHVIPDSAATAGVAAVSPAARDPLKACSRFNPCALATPARNHVSVSAAPRKTRVKYARAAKGRRA